MTQFKIIVIPGERKARGKGTQDRAKGEVREG